VNSVPDSAHDATSTALAEVRACFDIYEAALMNADFPTLRKFFAPNAVRFSVDGNQYGRDEIDSSRRASMTSVDRTLRKTAFMATCPTTVIAHTEFVRGQSESLGRQTQVWVRTGAGWTICHAHVSMISEGSSLHEEVVVA
jgi:ketosteroid isomerase-like protein